MSHLTSFYQNLLSNAALQIQMGREIALIEVCCHIGSLVAAFISRNSFPPVGPFDLANSQFGQRSIVALISTDYLLLREANQGIPMPPQQLDDRATSHSIVVRLKDCTSGLLHRARLSGFSIEYLVDKVEFSHGDHDEVDRFRSYLKTVLRGS